MQDFEFHILLQTTYSSQTKLFNFSTQSKCSSQQPLGRTTHPNQVKRGVVRPGKMGRRGRLAPSRLLQALDLGGHGGLDLGLGHGRERGVPVQERTVQHGGVEHGRAREHGHVVRAVGADVVVDVRGGEPGVGHEPGIIEVADWLGEDAGLVAVEAEGLEVVNHGRDAEHDLLGDDELVAGGRLDYELGRALLGARCSDDDRAEESVGS